MDNGFKETKDCDTVKRKNYQIHFRNRFKIAKKEGFKNPKNHFESNG